LEELRLQLCRFRQWCAELCLKKHIRKGWRR
jgi:hypothetical protein